MEASLGNLEWDSYAGSLYLKEGSGTGVSPYRGPVGEPEVVVSLPGTSRASWRALDHLSMGGL